MRPEAWALEANLAGNQLCRRVKETPSTCSGLIPLCPTEGLPGLAPSQQGGTGFPAQAWHVLWEQLTLLMASGGLFFAPSLGFAWRARLLGDLQS